MIKKTEIVKVIQVKKCPLIGAIGVDRAFKYFRLLFGEVYLFRRTKAV
jgi:hypothetical protein